MKPLRIALIVMPLIAAPVAALAQRTEDPFEELRRSLMRAAAQELERVETANASLKLGEAAESAEPVPAETLPAITRNSKPAFARLHMLLPLIRSIFREEDVPEEFILVGLIESGYQPDAISPAQAAGMWQFMPETARRFGLINDEGDFRTDVVRSTRAAARYLKVLLDEFQDWRLALAAYNAGEERVEEAIRKAQSRDYSRLSRLRVLPAQTLDYVPAVLRAIAEARNHGVLDADAVRPGGFYE